MRLPIVLAAGIAVLAAAALPARAGETSRGGLTAIQGHPAEAISAAKRKKRPSGQQAYGRNQTQIACTQFGCKPIPPGCRIRTGFNPFTWDPSGFDEVVCPYR